MPLICTELKALTKDGHLPCGGLASCLLHQEGHWVALIQEA